MYAGIKPDRTPTNILINIENTESVKGRVEGKNWFITRLTAYANPKPIIPAKKHIVTASIRNCPSIIPLVAPIAYLTPISLVLSLTVTNIMFIIPIPPTIRESKVMR